MPRPTNKRQLLDQSQANCEKLIITIDALTPDQQNGEFDFDDRDRNIRDALIYLHEWQNVLLNWERKNTSQN